MLAHNIAQYINMPRICKPLRVNSTEQKIVSLSQKKTFEKIRNCV